MTVVIPVALFRAASGWLAACAVATTLVVRPATAQTHPPASEVETLPPLHRAAYRNEYPRIPALVAEFGGVNDRDAKGRTAAHLAAFGSADDSLAALARAGADLNLIDGERYDVVTIAAVANDPDIVALALRLGNRADLVTSIYDGTALIAAAHLGHAEVVQHLIAGGAPLDHVNKLGWTALIEAVVLGDGGPDHIATARALLEAGADATITDRHGVTPLDHARRRGYAEMADLIARYGG